MPGRCGDICSNASTAGSAVTAVTTLVIISRLATIAEERRPLGHCSPLLARADISTIPLRLEGFLDGRKGRRHPTEQRLVPSSRNGSMGRAGLMVYGSESCSAITHKRELNDHLGRRAIPRVKGAIDEAQARRGTATQRCHLEVLSYVVFRRLMLDRRAQSMGRLYVLLAKGRRGRQQVDSKDLARRREIRIRFGAMRTCARIAHLEPTLR